MELHDYFTKLILNMRNLFLILLWFVVSQALAQGDSKRIATPNDAMNTKILQLERAMTRLSQESQAAYQQFLMAQEMRRNELATPVDPMPFNPTSKSVPIPNYDDMIQRRKDKDERLQKYNQDLDQFYSRYQSLEMEREEIFQKIKSLEQKKIEQ